MKGSVIKRGSKWAVVVDVGRDAAGKRVRKWHSGYPTRREAETARVEILSRLQRGEYVPPSRVTVGEWLDPWLEGRTGLAETTRASYETDVRRLRDGLGPHRLRDLTPATIGTFYRT